MQMDDEWFFRDNLKTDFYQVRELSSLNCATVET